MTRTRKRRVSDTNKHWSDSQRIEAVTLYMATGSPTQTCATLGIPLKTFEGWQCSVWFKEIKARLRDESHLKLDSRLEKIVQKSLNLIEDRLDNGNSVLDQKSGRVVKVPVNIRDGIKATTELMNRQDLIRKEPDKQVLEETIDNRLLKLAQQFAQFSKQVKKPIEKVIEGEVIPCPT